MTPRVGSRVQLGWGAVVCTVLDAPGGLRTLVGREGERPSLFLADLYLMRPATMPCAHCFGLGSHKAECVGVPTRQHGYLPMAIRRNADDVPDCRVCGRPKDHSMHVESR